MLDAEVSAKLVELMLSCGSALAQAKQPVGKSLSVVCQHPGDLHRCRARQITQEAARIGSGLCWIDADKDPACRPVDGDKEIPPPVLIGHLRQVFDVDMQIARLICLEGSVCLLGFLKWSQKTGQSAKVYPKSLKGYENGKAPELYRSV